MPDSHVWVFVGNAYSQMRLFGKVAVSRGSNGKEFIQFVRDAADSLVKYNGRICIVKPKDKTHLNLDISQSIEEDKTIYATIQLYDDEQKHGAKIKFDDALEFAEEHFMEFED